MGPGRCSRPWWRDETNACRQGAECYGWTDRFLIRAPHRARAMRRIVLAALALALAGACGGGGATSGGTTGASASTGGSGSLDPCLLVTSAEAAAVLGDQPDEPTNVAAGGVGACTYRLHDGSGAVQINVEHGDLAEFDSRTENFHGEAVDAGDKALANVTLGQVVVLKDDVLSAIFVSLPNDQHADVATLGELARTAAGRV